MIAVAYVAQLFSEALSKDLKNFFRGEAAKCPTRTASLQKTALEDAAADQSDDARLAADSATADAEVAKLATDLNELRQTLMRRQADFENFRKAHRKRTRRRAPSATPLASLKA